MFLKQRLEMYSSEEILLKSNQCKLKFGTLEFILILILLFNMSASVNIS